MLGRDLDQDQMLVREVAALSPPFYGAISTSCSETDNEDSLDGRSVVDSEALNGDSRRQMPSLRLAALCENERALMAQKRSRQLALLDNGRLASYYYYCYYIRQRMAASALSNSVLPKFEECKESKRVPGERKPDIRKEAGQREDALARLLQDTSGAPPNSNRVQTEGMCQPSVPSTPTNSMEVQMIMQMMGRPLEMVYDPSLDLLNVDLSSCTHTQSYTTATKYAQLLFFLIERINMISRFPWYDYARHSQIMYSVNEVYSLMAFSDYSPVRLTIDIIQIIRRHMQDTEFEDLQLFLLFSLVDFIRHFQRLFLPAYNHFPANRTDRDTCFLLKIVQALMNEQNLGRHTYEFQTLKMQVERRYILEQMAQYL